MNITIFKDLTTSDYLKELQVESEKYTGLYVDMNNAPERKYVKDKAYDIQQLLKKLNRARIDKSAAYKSQVEKEAASIVEQLETANLPFMSLINEYKAERAEILAGEKAANDLRVFLAQKEDAINADRLYDLEAGERARRKQEEQEQLKANALEQARREVEQEARRQKEINEAIERDKVYADKKRLADKAHIQKVKTDIYKVLVQFGLSDADAKTVIHLATIKELPNLTINY